ncbi:MULTISPECIES: hypothetical protein [unclassified Chryseobacterium]|uniref:hypothetical protein n=1 Tax=unclassified Chryseobacterium TaxID=2593645 RepID=UPI00100B25CE|nr:MULTISPECIES: hypothetical protein [unclassified Chryseobacterium]RXM50590.1 hypothetical protein BOQ64_17770 [Chryseobacterium sp. CH25]RXM63226.1 hypothetical protein BOQ60_17975 [Chryseobacterium sp. CH1]
MKTKLSYLFILLYAFMSCQEGSIINDLKIANYSGHPKKITEIITFTNQNINKSISYFDKDGFLTKIESYNLAKSQFPDKRFISDIIVYDSKNKAKRSFETVNPESKKIEAKGNFEKISDSLYKRVSNSDAPSMFLKKLFYFDKNNRLIKTEETGNFNGTSIHTIIIYSYINAVKTEMLVENVAQHKKSKLIYKNVKLDQKANSVYEELVDDRGILQQKVEREFEYY